jgi:type VI secretion system lysozyme-like protein
MKAGLIDVLKGKFQDDLSINQVDEDLHQLLSITDNLKCLLSARQGVASGDPNYGLPDIHDLQRRISDSSEELRSILAEKIKRFEPRLRKIRVEAIPAEQASSPLAYRIFAELPDRKWVSFQAVFRAGAAAELQLLSW